jgi:hypothetical protein
MDTQTWADSVAGQTIEGVEDDGCTRETTLV